MATREAIEARKEALERELDKREAALSTSERQARYVTGANRRSEDVADTRDVEREPAWGDDGGRPSRGDAASRRQAARITRGASSRGGDSDA